MEKLLKVTVDTDVARMQLSVAGWDYTKLQHMTDDAIFGMAVNMSYCYGVITKEHTTECIQLPIAGDPVYRCDNPQCYRKLPSDTDIGSVKFCPYCGAQFTKVRSF